MAKRTVENYNKIPISQIQEESDENTPTCSDLPAPADNSGNTQNTKTYTMDELRKLCKSQLAVIFKEKLGHSPSKKTKMDSMVQSILKA